MNYATLHQVKEYTGNLENPAEDARFTRFLKWSTALINGYKARRYDVRLATLPHAAPLETASSFGAFDRSRLTRSAARKLILKDDLLELVQFLNGDGSEITPAEYLLEPIERTPYSVIALRSGTTWLPDESGEAQGALSVKALWGYHPDYATAFVDSLETVAENPLAANTTQLQVADVNGLAADLDCPRFQAGQLLRIENELLYLISVHAVADAPDLLTVVRGYNGSTAAQHPQGCPIRIFRPDGNIVQACVRLVAWRFHQKDVDNFDRTYVAGTGVVSVPAALPADVRDALGAKGRPRR